ncbi:MAG: hypothetical protein V2A58_04995 [Planctomycetota bacterium]
MGDLDREELKRKALEFLKEKTDVLLDREVDYLLQTVGVEKIGFCDLDPNTPTGKVRLIAALTACKNLSGG